jgi:hypothetical protein
MVHHHNYSKSADVTIATQLLYKPSLVRAWTLLFATPILTRNERYAMVLCARMRQVNISALRLRHMYCQAVHLGGDSYLAREP